jgi:hypothetical protein
MLQRTRISRAAKTWLIGVILAAARIAGTTGRAVRPTGVHIRTIVEFGKSLVACVAWMSWRKQGVKRVRIERP